MANRPKAIAVLNTIQALAADLVLSAGLLTTDASSDYNIGAPGAPLVGTGRASTKTAYAAGTAPVKNTDLGAVSIVAGAPYRLAIVFPNYVAFPGGGQEANQMVAIREYVVFTDADAAAPTAAALAALFVARINADPQALGVASVVSTDNVRFTASSATNGDFSIEAPAGATYSTTTAYVAPSGTPAIVELAAPGSSSATGEYTTWLITVTTQEKHAAVSGGTVGFRNDFVIYADETAANFAAFETALDAILDGTHTPAADYL